MPRKKVSSAENTVRNIRRRTRKKYSGEEKIRIVLEADLRERIPGIYTMITIVLNLLILLTILAFISLFLHAWEYFKCTEQGLGGLMPGDCEKAPAVS